MNWSLIFSNAIYAAVGINAIGYCLIAVGLNVHFGYTGLLNFGQAAFAAVGAFSVAIPVSRYGWSLWATIPLVFVTATLLALLLGFPTLRLRADYLAIVTIAAAEIIRIFINSVRFTWLTGGNDGLQRFTGDLERINPISPHRFKIGAQSFNEYDLFVIIIGWLLVVIASVFVYLLVRSPWGRVIKSIREDEEAPRSLGKNIFNYKMQALIIGGVIGAFGGVMLAVGNRVAQPNNYSTPLTFFAYTILILGGVGKVKGPIIGAIIFWFVITFVDNVLAEATRTNSLPDWLVSGDNFGQVKFILSGLALAALVIFRPQGIFGDKREQAFDVRCLSILDDLQREPGVAKTDPILVVNGVYRHFGGLVAVDVEHLEIHRGMITALIGPNGAGKTTFFNVLTGFDKPNSGRWMFDGQDVTGRRAYALARAGMVRTFQLTKSLTRLSVLENMKLGATHQRGERLFPALLKPAWKEQEEEITAKADGLLERFRLSHMRDDYAGNLSGGQRKLLEMARALMADPKLIMLDEPMAGVNPALTQSLLGHVKSLRDDGTTVLFVEHDMDVVHDISNWVVVMAEGQVIAESPPDSVGSNERVIDAYLGAHHGTDLSRPDRRTVVSTSEYLLQATDLVAGYIPEVDILNGMNLTVALGEMVGIIGPNGAGKSTFLKAVLGLVPVRSGHVYLEGEDITGHKAHQLVARGVGYVPQTNNVFPSLTVLENLEMGTFLRPRQFAEQRDYVYALFPRLAERARQRTGSLSGGERQMVAMGRALMLRPRLLLLDEPSAGLSPALQDQVFLKCREINDTGVAVLMVEQNARRCLQVCHRGYVLDQGQNAYTGLGQVLLDDPKVVDLYLGTLAKAGRDGG